MSQAQVINELSLPGRLGDPNRTLKTDPRIDPRLPLVDLRRLLGQLQETYPPRAFRQRRM